MMRRKAVGIEWRRFIQLFDEDLEIPIEFHHFSYLIWSIYPDNHS